VRQCACGKIYYNPDPAWSWEEGELAALEQNPNAYGRDYAIGEVIFEGKVYADACDCWHARALRVIAFLHEHAEAIAEYLSEEKARKLREANRAPVVT